MSSRSLRFVSGATLGVHGDKSVLVVQPPDGKSKSTLEAPLKNVLWAGTTDDGTVQVDVIVKKRGVVKIEGKVSASDAPEAKEWVEELMAAAYAGASSHEHHMSSTPHMLNTARSRSNASEAVSCRYQPSWRSGAC